MRKATQRKAFQNQYEDIYKAGMSVQLLNFQGIPIAEGRVIKIGSTRVKVAIRSVGPNGKEKEYVTSIKPLHLAITMPKEMPVEENRGEGVVSKPAKAAKGEGTKTGRVKGGEKTSKPRTQKQSSEKTTKKGVRV